jgi:predicted aspartyl protease
VAAVVLLARASVAAELWRWTDADGVVRYTNDPAIIPLAFRAHASDIGTPQARSPESPLRAESIVLPFTSGGPITAAAHLNGVALVLMVDTGADRTMIAPAAVARAGLDPSAGREVRIVGVAGGARARELTVERLDIAGARMGPLAVVVHDAGVPGIDGLLGRDVLDYFTLTVDGGAGRVILTPR